MGLGDMMGKVAGMAGGDIDLGEKMGELGVDPASLQGMGLDKAKEFLAEKGLDLSALEGMGLDVEGLLAKFTGGEG